MIDVFRHIFELIFAKTRNNVQKIIYVLFFVVLALAINDHYGITKNLLLNRRLAQLEKLRAITPNDFDSNTVIQTEIAAVKTAMFDKTTSTQRIRAWATEQVRAFLTARGISATFFLLLTAALSPFIIIFARKAGAVEKVAWIILTLTVFLTWAYAMYKIQALIPDYRPRIINHVINLFLQFGSFSLFIYLTGKKEKVTVKDALREEYLRRMAMENMQHMHPPGNGGEEENKKES